MPRKGRKKMLGKRPDIEHQRQVEQLQELARELRQEQRQGLSRTESDLRLVGEAEQTAE